MSWADWKTGILMSPGLRHHQTLLLCASGGYQTPHRAPEPGLLSRGRGTCVSWEKLCHAQCGREKGSGAPEGAPGETRTQVILAVPEIQAFLCPSHPGEASLTLCEHNNNVREAPNLPVLTASHLLSFFRKETVSW